MLKIAIIKLSSLGDIVHASICVQFIKNAFKDAHISWFVDTRFGRILEFCDCLDEVIMLPLKDKKFRQSYEILRSHKGEYDIIIDLQGLVKSALIARILGKNSFGFDFFSAKERISAFFYAHTLRCDYGKNIILRNLELCEFALKTSFEKSRIPSKNPCFKAQNQGNSGIPSEKKRILIAPFASEQSKCYTHFESVIELLKDYEISIISGSQNEYEKAKFLAQNSGAKALEPRSLGGVIELLSEFDLIIGNDSGISHLAWAQNRATIMLFGNRDGARNSYATPKNIILQATPKHEIDARHIDKSDYCVNEIDPALIADTAKRLLNA